MGFECVTVWVYCQAVPKQLNKTEAKYLFLIYFIEKVEVLFYVSIKRKGKGHFSWGMTQGSKSCSWTYSGIHF